MSEKFFRKCFKSTCVCEGFVAFFFLPCSTGCSLLVPDQGWNPWPLQWKHGVLTLDHQEISQIPESYGPCGELAWNNHIILSLKSSRLPITFSIKHNTTSLTWPAGSSCIAFWPSPCLSLILGAYLSLQFPLHQLSSALADFYPLLGLRLTRHFLMKVCPDHTYQVGPLWVLTAPSTPPDPRCTTALIAWTTVTEQMVW